ncbi:MAG: hypothetical protein LBR06_08880 [Bacteroidales bacterium]|jgi:hypothetical protein|nr:hypothetical protein [Bacteroidales bacterium]
MKSYFFRIIAALAIVATINTGAVGQTRPRTDMEAASGKRAVLVNNIGSSRLTLGGYGEMVMQRLYYSNDVARYSYPGTYKDSKSGSFDLPHVVFYVAYDLGRGWRMSSEIEFEHGGTGATYEIENEESGEYETEIERGGEVALEQFWLEKSWNRAANLRMGHIVVPVGMGNMHHLPTEFFQNMRPLESQILPFTWHETGVSFLGAAGQWSYELQFIAGLDAERFGASGWINGASNSPYEYKLASNGAVAARVDNTPLKGLRIGMSGYYGHSAANTMKPVRYEGLKGAVSIGTVDAQWQSDALLARANFIYGHLDDSYRISTVNKRLPSASPSPRTDVASDALSWYAEAGYNVLPLLCKHPDRDSRLYLFAHYGYLAPMYKTADGISAKKWCERTVISFGANWFPVQELVIKAEYTLQKLDKPYNNEPALSFGVAYSGFFR